MESKISAFSEQLMEQLKKNMLVEFNKYGYLCDQLTVSDVLQSNMPNYYKYDDNKKNNYSVAINNIIGEKALFYNYINDLQINTAAGDVFYDRGYNPMIKKDIERINNSIVKSGGKDYWTYAKATNSINCIVIGRQINSINNSMVYFSLS